MTNEITTKDDWITGFFVGFIIGAIIVISLFGLCTGNEPETISPEPGIVCVVYGSKIDCMREENQDDK